MKKNYVHGYSQREASRLRDQANTLSYILHSDSLFPSRTKVLEAGCGAGAQTEILARKNPRVYFTSLDLSHDSIIQANLRIKKEGLSNVNFVHGDIFNLPFEDESFDHVFVCFVLEHLPDPIKALRSLKKMLKKGGSLTVIEGDHGSTFFYPDSAEAHAAIQCLVKAQEQMGGNSLIGRRLYPVIKKAGFKDVKVSPRMVYVDASRPELVDGFTDKTFTAMVKGVEKQALASGLIDKPDWIKGIRGLYRTMRKDGIFCYTFFKAFATKP